MIQHIGLILMLILSLCLAYKSGVGFMRSLNDDRDKFQP